MNAFNEANRFGLEHIGQVIQSNPFPLFDLEQYYRSYIDYNLDEEKRKGMDLFLQKLGELKPVCWYNNIPLRAVHNFIGSLNVFFSRTSSSAGFGAFV
jgi:hypothetical protein